MDNDVIDLRTQALVLRRRWRVIALFVVLGLAVACSLAYVQTPTYSAKSEVLVDPLSVQAPSNGIPVQPEEVATQLQVLGSEPVATLVIEQLSLSDSSSRLLESVTVTPIDETRVLSVDVTRTNAAEAAAIANSFAENYLSYRKERAASQADVQRQALSDQMSALQDLLSSADTQLETATGREQASLQAQRQGLLLQLTQLSNQLSELNTTGDGTLAGGQVLRPATVPVNAAAPRPIRMAVLGAIIGLLLGIGLAYVRDRFDDAVRDERRLDEAMGGRPVLGHIPHWSGSRSGRIVTIMDPHSPASEAFRALSTNVRFLLAATPDEQSGRRDNRTLLVTSAAPGEGKTSVAANLAVAACGVGLKVILVDADLRQPRLSRLFGLGDAPGLSDILAGGASAWEHLIDVGGVDNLRVLPGGSPPPNPAALLASLSIQVLFRELRRDCDLLILDSAPILRVADSLELVPDAGLVLLVARNRVSRLRNLTATVDRVRQVGGEVSGAVFNDLAAGASGYSPSYSTPTKGKSKKKAAAPSPGSDRDEGTSSNDDDQPDQALDKSFQEPTR